MRGVLQDGELRTCGISAQDDYAETIRTQGHTNAALLFFAARENLQGSLLDLDDRVYV
jgi:hypothetical protein